MLFSILWPLFHYLPGDINFEESYWEAYQKANMLFADTIVEIIKENDVVWVQDYHLMLLPMLLRRLIDPSLNVKIGFFLHTPFPSSEMYRVLPVRQEILWGLLHADLIGFHTYDYASHFLSSCTRILRLSSMPNGIEYEGRFVHIGTFPIGIDPDKFLATTQMESVKQRIAALKRHFQGKMIIVGVDRLDYIKGIPQKLHAFELFLEHHPEFREKAVLLQVAVPSRTDVEEYQNLRSNIEGLIGHINGRFGTVDSVAIYYLYKSVDFNELVALYSIADVCIVTST